MLFTALQSGMATMSDIDTGMLDKLLIAPLKRPSILTARVLADAVTMAVQAVILIVIGVAMGARFRAGWPGFVLLGVFAVAFGIAWASVSSLIALRTRSGLGLRECEGFGLSPDDFDFNAGTVRIRRQLVRYGSIIAAKLPKGGKERTVPVSRGVAEVVERWTGAHRPG